MTEPVTGDYARDVHGTLIRRRGTGWVLATREEDALFSALQRMDEANSTLRAQLAGVRERVAGLDRYDLAGNCEGESGYCRSSIERVEDGDYLDRDDVLAALDGAA